MTKPVAYILPVIRSKPKLPNLLLLNQDELYNLYLTVDRGCFYLKAMNYIDLYKEWDQVRIYLKKVKRVG